MVGGEGGGRGGELRSVWKPAFLQQHVQESFLLVRGLQPVGEGGVESEAAEVSGGRRSYGQSPSPPGIPVLSDRAQRCLRCVFPPCGVTDATSHVKFGIFLRCCSTRLFTSVDLFPIFSCGGHWPPSLGVGS